MFFSHHARSLSSPASSSSSSSFSLYLGLLIAMPYLPWHAYAQTTTSPTSTAVTSTVPRTTASAAATTTSTSAATSTTSAVTTSYTGTPSLVFNPISTLTACQSHLFTWQVYNEDPSKVNITLYAIDSGVNQTIPAASTTTSSSSAVQTTSTTTSSSRSSASTSLVTTTKASTTASTASASASASTAATTSLVARQLESRTTIHINGSIGTQLANHGMNFNPIALPEGRYYILGVVDDGHGTRNTSAIFSVVEGNDTSCLAAFTSQSKTASATATITTGGSTGTAAGASGASGGGGSGLSKGAIAGIAVGVILGLAALGLFALFCLRRRRNQQGAERYTSQPPMSTAGGRHQKMPSGPTSPSDQNHHPGGTVHAQGQGLIALNALRSDGSYRTDAEKGRSNESLMETMDDAVALPLPSATAQRTPTAAGNGGNGDPFATPRMDSVYGGYTDTEFDPASGGSGSGSGSGITPPQPAVLPRPTSYSDRTSRRLSGPINPVHRSSSQSRLSNTNAPTGLGLGTSPSTTPPAPGQAPGQGQVGRSSSMRRKPVPSLGPEWRSEMAKQARENERSPALPSLPGEGRRASHQLVADPPLRQ